MRSTQLNPSSTRSLCEINLDHLIHNYKLLSQFSGGGFCCPMVKSDAYGHGALPVAQALEKAGAEQLGVVFPEEGVELREAGIKTTILVFGGVDKENVSLISRFDLTPVASSWQQLDLIENEAKDQSSTISVHIKLDTGMHRLGFSWHESEKLLNRFWKNKNLRLTGVATHLAQGEDLVKSEGFSATQLQRFEQVVKTLEVFKPKVHALASAPLLTLSQSPSLKDAEKRWLRNLGTRIGLSLYGVNPLDEDTPLDLRPVMALKSRVVAVQKVTQGELVSYGGIWRATQNTFIGVVSFGYADGLPRSASNKIQFRIRGQQHPQVGTICMDFCMVDLKVDSMAEAQRFLDQEVVLCDDQKENLISGLAKAADTIPYEVMIRIGRRVARRYIQEAP